MILKEDNRIERIYLGKEYRDVMEIPHLIEIQLESYENFLQRKKLDEGTIKKLESIEKGENPKGRDLNLYSRVRFL